MDEQMALACIEHIRTAARMCEDSGLLAAWATLHSVADDLLERIDQPVPNN